MLRRRTRTLAALLAPAVTVLMCSAPLPAAAAPSTAHDILSGRWQISHTCLSGCTGRQQFDEVIRHRAGNVYAGRGGEPEMLYQLGSRVLVHAPSNSVLLTVRQPRILMSGVGITADGATFDVTWRCAGKATTTGAGSGAATAGISAEGSRAVPAAVEVC